VPLIGASIIILNSKKNLTYCFLAYKPLVFLGLISYSLYLWHYPILVLTKVWKYDEILFFEKIFVFFLTIFLSVIFYYSIEKPLRNIRLISNKSFFGIILFFLIIIFSSIFTIKKYDGFKTYFFKQTEKIDKNIFDNFILSEQSHSYVKKIKNFTQVEKQKILVVGDSHSKDMFNALYQNKDFFSDLEFVRKEIDIGDFFDEKRKNKIIKELNQSENFINSDIILISVFFNENELEGLQDFIDFLKQNEKKIILFSKAIHFQKINYAPKTTYYDIFIKRKLNREDSKNIRITNQEIVDLRKLLYKKKIIDDVNFRLKKIAKINNIILIEKEPFMCDWKNHQCDVLTDDGYKIFYDDSHWTLEGASHFGKKMLKNEIIIDLKNQSLF